MTHDRGQSRIRGERRLHGDYRTRPARLGLLCACAVPVGLMGGGAAWALLHIIGAITHFAYLGQWGTTLVAPAPAHWGAMAVAIPVLGGLAVGLLARHGSPRIRGHGIPEALEVILERDSVMEARVALVKPLASAIAIGTGGPFGAEGPIIVTAGALGSLFAQHLPLTARERRALLVAGAAAGMSATFGTPVSAVLLAVELLAFEWSPRSFLPTALASATAYVVRLATYGPQAVFAAPATPWPSLAGIAAAVGAGVVMGGLSGALTRLVYAVEDAYRRLPVHWMWWPALGGVAVGLGGWIAPPTLGVGYPTIQALDAGRMLPALAATLGLVKTAIWVVALSSGTSGGVLAPLLFIGGCAGALLSPLLPGHLPGLWATVGMAALLGGTMRAPFTATLFALETTHNWAAALPVFVASMAAAGVTVVWVPWSILTEKLARRGLHVAREYEVPAWERWSVQDALQRVRSGPAPAVDRQTWDSSLPCVGPGARLREAIGSMVQHGATAVQVVDEHGRPVATLTATEVLHALAPAWQEEGAAAAPLWGWWRRVRGAQAPGSHPSAPSSPPAGEEASSSQ
ncbi:MAG: chloride channel protein [Firmicutes bacterium]|nr:chloride channel protein [Bacillota bacterium]